MLRRTLPRRLRAELDELDAQLLVAVELDDARDDRLGIEC
jgi:hypothetical protein